MAKSECYLLLSNPPSASEVSENQLQIAQLWIESLGGRLDSAFNKKWTPETILARWNTWQKLNPLQREQALALELLRISPRAAAAQPVISLNAKEQLAALSTSNSERMLKQLAAAFPASKDAQNNVALTKLANQMAS
ncbi:MAG: hypothetical protein ACXWQE_07265, partial [Bdellovibrionales bacterium]